MTSCQSDLGFHRSTCADAHMPPGGAACTSLTNTYWRPVEISGRAVVVAAGQREPYVILEPNGNTMRGFTGCNQMQGRYEIQGDELHVRGVATTRMFCQETMEQERAFLHLIETVSHYKIAGEAMELHDSYGQLLGRFESRRVK